MIDCDASDSALAGFTMRVPNDHLRGNEIRRMLTDRELRGTEMQREVAGYALTTRTLAQQVQLRGNTAEIARDFKCAEIIFR